MYKWWKSSLQGFLVPWDIMVSLTRHLRSVQFLKLLFLFMKVKYVEASAKHKLNVEKAFHDLVRVIRQAQKPDSQKEKKRKKRGCTIL